MYRANYISKGLSWRMPMDGRLSKGCTAHGKAWKVLEGTGLFWTCVIRVCAWMTERLYASCFLSCLIVVSLPYLDMWTLLILTHCCLLLLTDCLLSMTHYAYYTLVEVLISCSRVTGSSPAWLLVFTTAKYQVSIAEPLSLPFPVWIIISHLLSGLYSISLAPLFSCWCASSSTSSTSHNLVERQTGLSVTS